MTLIILIKHVKGSDMNFMGFHSYVPIKVLAQ